MRGFVAVMGIFLCVLLTQRVDANNWVCGGNVFNDVNATSQGLGFCYDIERFASLGITHGCSQSPPLYCPDDYVTRAQMAAFFMRATDAGDVGPTKSLMETALLDWYDANKVATFVVGGTHPYGIAFDGANIWVANYGSSTVSKL